MVLRVLGTRLPVGMLEGRTSGMHAVHMPVASFSISPSSHTNNSMVKGAEIFSLLIRHGGT